MPLNAAELHRIGALAIGCARVLVGAPPQARPHHAHTTSREATVSVSTVGKGPQKQHYISKSLIKRWADENHQVGVVCTYHRRSAIVHYRTLHRTCDLSSPELEDAWDADIENPAALAVDGLVCSLGPQLTELEAAHRFLSEPKNLGPLIDLARLHHARSLAAPIQQFVNSQRLADSAETAAMIQHRWDSTQDYHDHGVVITVFPAGSPQPLGAAPVFDTTTWGRRESVDLRFMMPLTPRVMISGTAGLPPRQVEVVAEDIEPDRMQQMPLAGEPGLFPTLWMICQPSALQATEPDVLRRSEGGGAHWFAIGERIARCDDAAPEQQAKWERRSERHKLNQTALETRALRESVQRRIYDRMRDDARETQHELDALDAPICTCSALRDGHNGQLWQLFMPQTVCDSMR